MAFPISRCVDCLLVDNDVLRLAALTRVLEQAGHHCTVCRAGREAIALCSTLRFDCIVLAALLPDGAGLAVAQRLRMTADSPHVVMVGDASKEDYRSALREGVIDAYLERPAEQKALAELVARALRPASGSPDRVIMLPPRH